MSTQLPPPPPNYTEPTTTQPGSNPMYGTNPVQTQQPPPYSGGVQTGVPGAGYGTSTTLQSGTYVMGNTVSTGMSPLAVARDPTNVTCQYCNKTVVTRVDYVNGQTVTFCALIICLMGAWCGCCLIPCCMNQCKDADHYCPECNMKLGTAMAGSNNRAHHY